MNNLVELLNRRQYACQIDKLKLMHTANGDEFKAILRSGQISPSACKVFKPEKLAYFFLGRPAYKTSVVEDPSHWQLPAVFVFNKPPDLVPIRVFPFDSGALATRRYQKIIGKISRSEFTIPSDWEAISELIGYFFSDYQKYLSGKPVPYQEISERIGDETSKMEILAVAKLYNHHFNSDIDDRARLVELQYSEAIPLTNEYLSAIICCKEWTRDHEINSMIRKTGAKVLTYPIYPTSSASYYGKIYELSESIKP